MQVTEVGAVIAGMRTLPVGEKDSWAFCYTELEMGKGAEDRGSFVFSITTLCSPGMLLLSLCGLINSPGPRSSHLSLSLLAFQLKWPLLSGTTTWFPKEINLIGVTGEGNSHQPRVCLQGLER